MYGLANVLLLATPLLFKVLRWKKAPESMSSVMSHQMVTHGLRAPEKEALNLEVQHNPSQVIDIQ